MEPYLLTSLLTTSVQPRAQQTTAGTELTASAASETHCKSSTERSDPCCDVHTSKADDIDSIEL